MKYGLKCLSLQSNYIPVVFSVKMLKTILLSLVVPLVILLIAVLAMAFRPLFVKGGRFPNIHIGGNKALKQRGITCATSQDREAQNSNKPKQYKRA